MTIKDRGTKKWGGFFVPEHLGMLRNYWEESRKVPRPELDEQAVEEMERVIAESLEKDMGLVITTWKNGTLTETFGTIHEVDMVYHTLKVRDEQDNLHTLPFYEIVGTKPAD